jgi:hypothetical protein
MKGIPPQSRQSSRLFLQSSEFGPPPPPPPHLQASVSASLIPGGGTRLLTVEGWGPNCDKGTDTVVLLVYMYCTLWALPWLVRWACSICTRDFCSSQPSSRYFFSHRTLFQFFCPYGPTSCPGSRAGSPVSKYVYLAPSAGKTVNFCICSLKINLKTKKYSRENISKTAHNVVDT